MVELGVVGVVAVVVVAVVVVAVVEEELEAEPEEELEDVAGGPFFIRLLALTSSEVKFERLACKVAMSFS